MQSGIGSLLDAAHRWAPSIIGKVTGKNDIQQGEGRVDHTRCLYGFNSAREDHRTTVGDVRLRRGPTY